MDSRHGRRPEYGDAARQEMLAFLPASARRVLDIGCNTGAFGAQVKQQRDAEVWGLEPHLPSAQQASGRLDKVLAAPFTVAAELPDGYFDAIFFNDVLEHLADPWAALALAAQKLASDGVVIASIPNLRHIDNLEHIFLEADFRYEGQGIRDRTHLRFFTRKSAVRLFEDCGYRIARTEGINASWWSPSMARRLSFRLFGKWLEDTKYRQFVLVARAGPGADLAPPRTEEARIDS